MQKAQWVMSLILQTIASKTQGHSAICSCQRPFPNDEGELSISQKPQEHPPQRSCPVPNQRV